MFGENKTASVVSIVSQRAHSVCSGHLWNKPAFKTHISTGGHVVFKAADKATQNLLQHMEECCDFIQKHHSWTRPRQLIENLLPERLAEKKQSGVLVHCSQGVSRSATIIIAYLMRKTGRPFKDILKEVQQKRSIVMPTIGFKRLLEVWEKCKYSAWEDGEKMVPKKEYQDYLNEMKDERKFAGWMAEFRAKHKLRKEGSGKKKDGGEMGGGQTDVQGKAGEEHTAQSSEMCSASSIDTSPSAFLISLRDLQEI